MASFINTNMASLNTQNNLTKSQAALNTSIQRLSSGMRVNSAKDDAAGYAIANRMDSTIRGQNVAIRNANDAISFSQTAEGAMSKISDNLQRMRELAVQSANGTNGTDDRNSLNTEFAQLQAEITRISSNTKFNGFSVLDGASNTFQIGSGTGTDNQITISGVDLTAATSETGKAADVTTTLSTLGVATTDGINILDQTNAVAAMSQIDASLKEVNTETIKHGAHQNRFQAVIATLQVSVENQTTSRSRIMDTDYAAETATMARGQILQQAGMAMLAQANQLPNGVMALMKG
jgi:flagellin